MTGWVKLWRQSIDSGLMQNPEIWMFWCWCLMKATHKPIKQMIGYQMVELKPGQFIFGRKMAAESLPLSEQTIRTCLRKLKNLGNLTIKPTNKFTIITVVNWDTYQNEDEHTNQLSNQHLTSSQPAANHKQECKNVRSKESIKKNGKQPKPPSSQEEVVTFFLENGYTKEAALKAYNYYEDNNWRDGQNKPVLSWKQKMRAVWFKPENELKETSIGGYTF